jgi:hypothetical protein
MAACETVGKHGGDKALLEFRLRELEQLYAVRRSPRFQDLSPINQAPLNP